jgi:hypothetical protein
MPGKPFASVPQPCKAAELSGGVVLIEISLRCGRELHQAAVRKVPLSSRRALVLASETMTLIHPSLSRRQLYPERGQVVFS